VNGNTTAQAVILPFLFFADDQAEIKRMKEMSIKAKRALCMILILVLTLSLCACGGGTGGKDSSKLDLDYEGGNDTQEQQEQQSGFQSWINEAFSFGKKESESSSANDQQGSSGSQAQQGGQSSQGGQSGQSGRRFLTELCQLPTADLSLEGWGEGKTEEKFSSELWDKLYKPCLGCGTCTFVCPTCQCYDIKDYTTKNGVQRYRCWDSCMYSDFTLMAGGQNRHTQLQRFRQRFMHKLVYYPTNNDGMFMCVGCGRCVEKCPQSLNIVKVIRAFAENK